MKSQATIERRRPACPFCGRKRLRSVGKHVQKCEKAQSMLKQYTQRLPVWS